MKSLYDEDYYERGIETGKSCYSNYRWMPELTIPMAFRLIEYLNISEDDKVLDFGCAKGYLVKSLRLLHRQAYGYDQSEYAISKAPEEIRKYVSTEIIQTYDWIISKDVFEHISYEEIDGWIGRLSRITKNMFAIVPLGENGKYVVPAYEMDETHVIRENIEWWTEVFDRNGFHVEEALYKVKYIKDNWNKWEKGNGFFVLRAKDDK